MMQSNLGKIEMDSSEPSIRISHSSRIIAMVVPNFLQRAFSDPSLEHLYQSYRVKQKRVDILCFLYASLLFDIYTLSSWATVASTAEQHGPNAKPPAGPTDVILPLLLALLTVFNAALLLVLSLPPAERLSKVMEVVWTVAPHAAWHAATGQLIATLLLAKHAYVTPRELLGWVLLLDYLIYVTLPLRLRYCLTLSLVTCVSYLTIVGCLGRHEENLGQQVGANCALLLATNVLGLTSYFLSDKQQRRAFLETRQSLEVKLLIEEQSAEQERLLLSVLPEHVAVKMRQDLGEAIDSQFKKIYMSRHENVSILYADIVGFTAISSTYSASELVKILNELFARFDRLAEKYHQLRIKILGDCYYCISGAPKERPDHAILCVHMGLSMVKAIKYVQNTTNSPVDMRVGIHTGAVLAGVLGQRQWQFDVYSKDVELANKMESSGMKGRVHISERTLGYLDGHFEVEPAHGEKREEALRLAGIKTFFIVRALKPFEGSSTERRNGGTDFNTEETTANGDSCYKEESMTIQVYNNDSKNRMRENSQDFKRRLRQDLLSRDGHRDVAKHIRMLRLGFSDPTREKAYHSHKASFPAASTLGCPLAALALWLAQTVILPWHVVNYIAFALGFIMLAGFATVAVAETFSNKFPPSLVKWSAKLNGTLWIRTVAGSIAILILTILNIINMAFCSVKPYANCSSYDYNDITTMSQHEWDEWPVRDTASFTTPSPALCTITSCLYPSYYSPFVVLILVVTSLVALLSHATKLVIMCVIVALQIGMNFGPLRTRISCERLAMYGPDDVRPIPDDIALTCLLVAVVIALHFLNRHVEKASRVLFVWRMEVEEQREKAADMRRRNESLVYNILPPHVAAHFLRPRRHDELYSQSYAEVGVLFASMPNFSDFYTEETVNNQGLECLRFLNEVISDYDALLERPEFQDIIKIKTIGSTYMAASGLNIKVEEGAEDTEVVAGTPNPARWAHLALLVEFAFELKRALTSINEQSFNHFVLKMGINHGPITAGVIGARKPHYDIWGNSVNVASRMESTGKAGCIQVTEETCGILRPFGYQFEQRGLVSVKGKGQLMTYYLIGKGNPSTRDPVSLSTDQISADVTGGDEDVGCTLKSVISGNSATQLLASSIDE